MLRPVTFQYRSQYGVAQTTAYVADEVRGPIIGSGDIDSAAAQMNHADLRAWITNDTVFQRLTANAKLNVRQRGL